MNNLNASDHDISTENFHESNTSHTSHLPPPEIAPGFPLEGPYLTAPPPTGDHWEQCHKAVEWYDNAMCKSWREEIDTLLVFAGLFTAIVTAFTVESYQWLQPDPAETTNQLLSELILLQRGNISSPAPISFTIPAYAVRVNCCWFLSITISLGAGVIGILCKQWIREYERDAALPPEDALALRQLRYIGWKRWGVPHIISSPAILLQLALLLFLGGLVDLLWNKVRCQPVAVFATAMVSLIASSMGLTTVLPFGYFLYLRTGMESNTSLIPQCAFKSPQSYLVLKLWDLMSRPIHNRFKIEGYHFGTWLAMERKTLARSFRKCGQWLHPQPATILYRSMALEWVQRTLAFNSRIRDCLFHCLQESRIPCGQDDSHFHLSQKFTEEECKREPFPDFALYTLYAEQMLGAEILMRNQLLAHKHTPFNLNLTFRNLLKHPVQVNAVIDQGFKYAQYCNRYQESAQWMWQWIFKQCVPQVAYEAHVLGVLQSYMERISVESDSEKCVLNCTDFIFAFDLQAVGRLLKSMQGRPTFELLLACVKKSRYYLWRDNPQGMGFHATTDIIQLILKDTSLPRDFFDDEALKPPRVQGEYLTTADAKPDKLPGGKGRSRRRPRFIPPLPLAPPPLPRHTSEPTHPLTLNSLPVSSHPNELPSHSQASLSS